MLIEKFSNIEATNFRFITQKVFDSQKEFHFVERHFDNFKEFRNVGQKFPFHVAQKKKQVSIFSFAPKNSKF